MDADAAVTLLDIKRLGGTIGGKVVPNRLFYFGGFEWYDNVSSNTVDSSFPAENRSVPHMTRHAVVTVSSRWMPGPPKRSGSRGDASVTGFVEMFNATNTVNLTGYLGDAGSNLFGRPAAGLEKAPHATGTPRRLLSPGDGRDRVDAS